MPTNNTPISCTWHADFRNLGTIPNLLFLKSLQVVSYVVALLSVIGVCWCGYEESELWGQRQTFAKIEQDFQALLPKKNEVSTLSQTFWEANNWVLIIRQGYEPHMEATPLLALLARLKPAGVELVEINLQLFAPSNLKAENTTPTASTTLVPVEKNTLKVTAVTQIVQDTAAISTVEELKKIIASLPLPELAKWGNIQTTNLGRESATTAAGTPQEILKFTIEAEFSL